MPSYGTVNVDLGDGPRDYFGVDAGDGYTYFMGRYMYRINNATGQVQQSIGYDKSQAWVNRGASGSSGTYDPSAGGGSVAPNADVETFVQWCIGIANDASHGYDQASRNGPDYDCSSLIWWGLHNAGFDVGSYAFNTDSMPSVLSAAGWVRHAPVAVDVLQRGDILLKNGHTELYVGNQQNVGAHSNEFGGITGGRTGDQSGNEISVTNFYAGSNWTSYWRYGA